MMKQLFVICLFICSNMHTITSQEHINRAQQYEKEKNVSRAIIEYTAAMNADPQNLMVRFLLGNAHANQYDFSSAYEQFNAILKYNSSISGVLYNAAYCLKNLGKYEQAIALYSQAIALEPTNTNAYQGRAHAQLALGNYLNAWEDFEYRWSKPRPDAQHFTHYMKNNRSVHGKRIALRAEFGLGDTLQFIRYAQELKNKGATVIVQAQKPLIPLLSLCPYIDELISTDQTLPSHDLSTVLMSLPWAFNSTPKTIPSTIPYLFVDQTLSAQWQTRISSNDAESKEHVLKIGICWNGNAYDTAVLQKLVEVKSIPLSLLAQLKNKHIQWYSLQKISGMKQLKNIPSDFAIHTFDDFDESHGRFMDTAALMKNMDLIITVDTSIAHLAGGLGVKTWLLLPHVADWRWGVKKESTDLRKPDETEGTDWYPTMKLFRQTAAGNWQSVIDQLKNALDQLLLTQESNLSLDQIYQRGVDYTQEGNPLMALEYFKLAYHRMPTHSSLAHALASTHRKLNNLDDAAYFYRRALQDNPASADSSFGLSLTLLAQGNNKEGWEFFNCWRSEQVIKKCPGNLQDVCAKKVVILAEWGLGDMIHYMRYATLLKKAGAYVILQTHKPLCNLFKGCDYIDEIIPAPQLPDHADYYIPLLYLPTLCKTTNETIPAYDAYIKAPAIVQPWLDKIISDKNFKIGICWDIGHHDTNIPAWQRSAPLEHWLGLATLPKVSFYSLQKDDYDSIKKYAHQMPINEFGPTFDAHNGAFMDSALLMKHMDLIITVDTAIAHLAGALGVNTWTLLPFSPDYRWGLKDDTTQWYPSMQLFRQKNSGDWCNVFEEVKQALEAILTPGTLRKKN